MKWKLVALTAAVACVLPLAGCATGPAAGPQGDMTDSGFATGTLCIDGQKFAAADSSGGCNTWCFLVLQPPLESAFLVFPESKQPPKLVEYFGKVLPYAMIGLLVVYALRNTPILTGRTAFRNSSPVPSSHCCICGSATCCFRPPAAPRCICC